MSDRDAIKASEECLVGTTRGLAYRGYWIRFEKPPIPASCGADYSFAHDGHDGAEDSGDTRCGSAASIAEAKAQIDEQIAEETALSAVAWELRAFAPSGVQPRQGAALADSIAALAAQIKRQADALDGVLAYCRAAGGLPVIVRNGKGHGG